MRRSYAATIFTIFCLLAFPTSSWAIKIVIDPGHGGSDSGAVGVNGLYEKTVNLDISAKLKTMLIEHGYEAAISREDDSFLTLQERVEFTNQQQADLFVSVHANAMPGNAKTRGALILYHDNSYQQEDYPASPEMTELTPQSREFAQVVLGHFVDATGMENRGLVKSAVYVVRMGTIPSILVETGFLTNRQDAALLATDEVRTGMAEAIAQGIKAYMPPDAPSEAFTDMRDHWAREAVLRLKSQGIVDGVGRLFKPNRELTRAEWMTLLDRVFDLTKTSQPLPSASSVSCTNENKGSATVTSAIYKNGESCTTLPSPVFYDTAGHWASVALTKAVDARILEGYDDATLRPDQPITRSEVAATFQRLALPLPEQKLAAETAGSQFFDLPASHWAAGSVASLQNAGWIEGISADSFMPDRKMTRAEAAALLDRYVQSKS
ncbi:N-acetylmuramoyl-L-alanine amidase [Paenibacillus agricola]|uniref:N-acetylmuramoyl-L-alanine amidase n=1 Tax=Paenibacillus agricola TaxID=2716264 RepID=A0ABX0J3V6_9BACL|nr:N-acetylmuramoyl-L-alanine amidase [Paenibacillus agricola]NHN30100.1 N-acetylmuramoyl-L-alanine amidase [Paenibacillus agricola]